MKSFKKLPNFKRTAMIVLILMLSFNIFHRTTLGENVKLPEISFSRIADYADEFAKKYKIEKMKNLKASEVDLGKDANFILKNFNDFNDGKNRDLKNLTREDLKRIKVRDAKVADLPVIIEMHNKGLNKGIWCRLPYKTSAWALIKEYYDFRKKYGDNNVAIYAAEIDGRVVAVMGGIQDGEKAVNNFTFIDVDIPEKLWAEILVKITLPFYELAKERNLNTLEARSDIGTWFEGFARDVMKAKNISKKEGIWHFDRDFILSRAWTEKDFEYTNFEALKRAEDRNAKKEDSVMFDQNPEEIGKIFIQTENSETYRRKDGLREILIYPSAVNIKIKDKWFKIDEYLKQPENMEEEYAEARKKIRLAPHDVLIGTDENNKNILINNKDGNRISFSLENISYEDSEKKFVLAESSAGKIVHSYKTGIFKDIFEGVDLKYFSTKNGIKEELIFNDPKILKIVEDPDYFGGKIVLRTRIDVSENIKAEMKNNQVYFEKDGKMLFSTSQPFIYDQEKRNYNAESNLKKENGSYYLEIILDYGWMTSDEKAYPLVLDPDLNINPSADVNLCADSGCATVSAVGNVFIKFDISGIPDNANLHGAKLILTHSTATANSTVEAKRFIDQTWNESSAYGTFTGTNFGSVLSTVAVNSDSTQEWNIIGNENDGLLKDFRDGNAYFSVSLATTAYTFTPAYVQNGTTLIIYYSGDKAATYTDAYHSREGTTPPILKVTYNINSTIFDYNGHPVDAKSIFNSPGATGTRFRN